MQNVREEPLPRNVICPCPYCGSEVFSTSDYPRYKDAYACHGCGVIQYDQAHGLRLPKFPLRMPLQRRKHPQIGGPGMTRAAFFSQEGAGEVPNNVASAAERSWPAMTDEERRRSTRRLREARMMIDELLEEIEDLVGVIDELLPYAQASIGLPESTWSPDNVILRGRAALAKAR